MDSSFWHKDIRLAPGNYVGCRWYFVTICTFARRSYFRSQALADWLLRVLQRESAGSLFFVRAYCLMPNHLHLLLQGNSLNAELLPFIENFKHKTSHRFWLRNQKTLWQISFYDHILRNEDAPGDVAWYIWLNPVRAGLAKRTGEYRYAGPFFKGWDVPLLSDKAWRPPKAGSKDTNLGK
jgi:putative transposase